MSEIARELPKYRCHKEVWALKIKSVVPTTITEEVGFTLFFDGEGYAPVKVSSEWVMKHAPRQGGYYVVYEDGYKSFSPAEAFESGYTIIANEIKVHENIVESEIKKQIDSFMIESGDGMYCVCLNQDGGWYGWLFFKHADGGWVSLRKALPEELSAAKSQLERLKMVARIPVRK